MNKNTKKLTLSRETLLNLTPDQLETANGGVTWTVPIATASIRVCAQATRVVGPVLQTIGRAFGLAGADAIKDGDIKR